MARSCVCWSTSTSRWVPGNPWHFESQLSMNRPHAAVMQSCITATGHDHAMPPATMHSQLQQSSCTVCMWCIAYAFAQRSSCSMGQNDQSLCWQDNWVVAWAPGASADLAWEWANYKVHSENTSSSLRNLSSLPAALLTG